MKIAVACNNGTEVTRFGKAEAFVVYDTEGARSEAVIEEAGHDARVAILKDLAVDAVVCSGLGEGAQEALKEAGIELAVSDSAEADLAVTDYLNGVLSSNSESSGCGCGCGGDDEGGCGCGGDDAEGGCGCGGCGGGCAPQIILEGKNAGKVCRVHYRGTLNDGTQFDASYDRGEPLEFLCGAGQMIKGFDEAVVNMEIGQEIDIHLMPEEAYGMPSEDAIFTLPMSDLPGSEELNIGQQVYVSNQFGQQFPVTVTAKENGNITLDANHEMAGKELNFHIELISVEE